MLCGFRATDGEVPFVFLRTKEPLSEFDRQWTINKLTQILDFLRFDPLPQLEIPDYNTQIIYGYK